MAKNTPKNKKSSLNSSIVTKISKYKKELAGVVVIVLLIAMAGVLMANGRKDTTTKVTSAQDLAKSSVNTKNTKDIPTTTTANQSSATASAPAQANAKKATTTKTSGASGSTSTSSGTGGSSNSSGTTAGPAAPAEPFRINDGPYTSVDNGYTSIGCNESTRFTFSSNLTANKAGTATYHWERSDGAQTSDRQVTFGAAGTLIVTNTWDLSSGSTPGTYEVQGWQKMVVTSPNETFSKASDAAFTLAVSC